MKNNSVNKRYVPKLRFKGFENTWQIEYVKNLFYITRGYVLSKNKLIENGFPVYSSQTLNNGLLGFYDQFLYEDSITWTTDGANAGTINFRKGKFYCTNVCGVLLEKKEKPSIYFSYLLSRITKKYVSYGLGNPKLMNNTMGDIEIIYSVNLKEQEKISKFLNLLDKQISLLENKLKLTEQMKKYYLFSCFSQKPILRFKEFSNKHKSSKIGELFAITRGFVLSKKNIVSNGLYPVYSSQTLNNGLLGCYDQFLYEDSITWTTDGANAGTINFRKGKFYCTNVCGVLLKDKATPNLYFANVLSLVSKKYVSYGLGNPKLMNNTMNNITINYSDNINEQLKLSEFIEKFDFFELNIKHKIQKIKERKKFYLINLFI